MKESNRQNLQEHISALLSKINYDQIEEALSACEFLDNADGRFYSFMGSDFGLSFIGDFKNSVVRQEFRNNYSVLDEYHLYKYYLLKSEIDFMDHDRLDFDKIYEILKFNITNAFAGGGGSTEDQEVYAVIKLLELHFKTSLGYPKKLCNSENIYGCDSRGRANAWMNYLQMNKHLKKEHNSPVSFAYKEINQQGLKASD